MTTQQERVENKKEGNKMHEGFVWITDHTCGRREAVEECGEQPREARGKRARQNGSQGEKGRNCRQEPLTRVFSHTLCTCVNTTFGLKVSQVRSHSIHMSSMMSHV